MAALPAPTGEIRLHVEAAVGHLVVANPRKRNAMSIAMWQAFADGIASLDADPRVRVIVVQGEGGDFVSGADIAQFDGARSTPADQAGYDAVADRAYAAPGLAGKPVVAAIRGICMGGGLGLAAACDLRICSTDARFRMPAARLGLGYGVEGVARFVSLLGPQSVLDLFMTARVFDGAEALRLGFVVAAEPPERFADKVAELAATIAQNAPLTLRAVKRAVRVAQQRDDASLAAARQALQDCAASADYLEGKRAFAEKRAPLFTGT